MEDSEFDFIQLHYNAEIFGAPFVVKGYKADYYPESSVLAGETLVAFIDSYRTEEEAVKAHPLLLDDEGEIVWGSKFMDDHLKNVDHIPDEPDLPLY
tara:strand:- start:1107 stop:1397 length:291 start_codon:yes stop_codon:yes gene_type:complete